MKRTFISILIVHRHIKERHIHCEVGLKTQKIHWLSNKKIDMIWKMETVFEAIWIQTFHRASRKFNEDKKTKPLNSIATNYFASPATFLNLMNILNISRDYQRSWGMKFKTSEIIIFHKPLYYKACFSRNHCTDLTWV
jgi:hypothetical protein